MNAVKHPIKRSFVFFLVPDFTMVAFATALDPLRLGQPHARLRRLQMAAGQSSTAGRCKASNGVECAVNTSLDDERRKMAGPERPSMVIVCSGINVETYHNRSVFAWMREEYNRGVAIGGLCTGAYVLAAAGLLSNKRCAIHWENLPGFSEAFPKANVFADLFEVDQNIYTCAGGTAALDMMLKLIGDDFDDNLVNRVCEQVLTDRVRSPTDRQRLPLRARLGVQNSKVLTIIELMEAQPFRAAVADRDRRQCRPVAPPDRAPVPPGDGPLAGPLLSGDQARPRPSSADPVVDAGGRGGGRLRLRLGLAFLEMLPRALRPLAAAGTRRPQAVAGGVSALFPCPRLRRGEGNETSPHIPHPAAVAPHPLADLAVVVGGGRQS